MKLTNNQKKYLRSMAHDLKPFVMIGQHGLSESVLAEMESTMLKHELIKIKLRISDREEKLKIINKIIELSKAEEPVDRHWAVTLISRTFWCVGWLP